MARLIRVLSGVAGGLALAGLATLNLIDQWAVYDRVLVLPISFGPDHSSGMAEVALGRNDLASATRLATAALQRQPLDERAARVLGTVALIRGDLRTGDRWMRFAGERGWRDPVTQLYWGRVALAGGAVDIAAQRADAVLRGQSAQGPSRAEAFSILRGLEGTAPGRAAILARLREQPAWAAGYLPVVAGLDRQGIQNRLALLSATTRRRIAVSPVTFTQLQWSLLNARQFATALDVCHAIAPSCEAGRINNGGFTNFDLSLERGPFDWTPIPSSAIELDLVGGEGGHGSALRVTSSAPVSTPIIRQFVMLSPGNWRIRGIAAGAHSPAPLFAEIACLPTGSATARPFPTKVGWFAIEVTISAGCTAQLLQLDLASSESTAPGGASILLDNIAATRTGPAERQSRAIVPGSR